MSLRAWLPDPDEVFDILTLALAPRRFLRRMLRRFRRRDGGELLLVGTIHGLHIRSTTYPLKHLENLVRNYCPEAIGLEILPEDLVSGLIALGPIEMAHLAIIAAQLGIPTFGFDDATSIYLSTGTNGTRFPRLDFNSALRNDKMASLLLEKWRSPQRVVAFTGYSHLRPLVARLVASSCIEVPLRLEEQMALWQDAGSQNTLRHELVHPIQRAVNLLRERLAADNLHPALAQRIKRKISFLSKIVGDIESN